MNKLFILFILVLTHLYSSENIHFGVFAYKGVEQTRQQYEPLVKALNEKLDKKIILEVLTQDEINEKISKKELDIVTTNPTHFLVIRDKYALSGAIATLSSYNKGVTTNKLAGVIIVKSESKIKNLKDIKDKIIATPSKSHMGGCRAQMYELSLVGIDISKKSKKIIEMRGSHQEVVRAVLSGKADVGFIRDGILESMLDKKSLKMGEIRVINEQKESIHPYEISTKLYPEWPVFSLPHVEEEIVKKFIATLFLLKPSEEMQKNGIYNYTLPADYLKVEELSRALRLPPFDKARLVTVGDILNSHKIELIIILFFLLLSIFYHLRERKRKNFISSLLSNIGEGVYGIDDAGKCTWINKRALEMLGYSEKEILYKNQHDIFHHHKPSLEKYDPKECPIEQTSVDKKTRTLNEHFIKKDGSFVPINLTVTSLKDGGAIVVFRDISESIKNEENLRIEKQRLDSIIEGTNIGTWEWNIKTDTAIFNERWAEIIGYTLEELSPISLDTWVKFSDSDGLSSSQERLQKHLDGEIDYYESEMRMKHKDGHWIWVLDRGKVFEWDDDGKPFMMSGTHQDITQRKLEQEELKNINNQLESLLESIPDLVWMKDINGFYITCNKRFEDFFGAPFDEIKGKTDYDFVSKELADFFTEHDKKAMYSEVPLTNFEEITFAKDSHKEFLQTTKTAVKDKSGAILGILGIGRDISELKKSEQELIDSKKLLDLFFKQSIHGFFFMMLDEPIEWNDSIDKEKALDYIFEHQRITKVNEAMLNQYGAKEEEFLYLTPKNLFAHNIQEGRKVWKEFFDKGSYHIHTNEQKFDGTSMIIEGDYICLHDNDGKITGHFGVQREVTQEIMAKEALEKAKEEAEKANKSKSQFLANMSHEIRTPMNAIIGFSEILLDSHLDEKQLNQLQKITISSKMLLSIINDILDFSKIEANMIEIEYEEFSLATLLSQTMLIFSQNAQNKGIKLSCDILNTLPNMVIGDELRVNQVLTNLMSNALKFTKEGEVKLSAKLKEKNQNSVVISFKISDTGIGIHKKNIKKLFTPFSQADSSTTRKYGGTGLGLSISLRLLEAMNSQLKVESEIDVGSVFSFDLAFDVSSWKQNELSLEVASIQHIKKKSLNYPNLSHINILLVEDNMINQEVVAAILQRVKITPQIANNGKEGVTIFLAQQNLFDIILMDLQMPIMSGYEATKIIREHDKKIPIIALTAAATIEDRNKVLKEGMNDHLPKPIDSEEMLRIVLKWLDIKIEQKTIESSQEIMVLDIEHIKRLVNGNESLVQKILSQFLKDLEKDFMSLPKFINTNDPLVKSLLHTLKGVSGNVGAKELSFLSQEIHDMHAKEINIPPQKIDNLRDAINRLHVKLKEYIVINDLPLEKNILSDKELQTLLQELLIDVKNASIIPLQKQKLLFNALKDKVDASELEIWINAMDDFEYDEAYEIMKRWELL